MSQSVISDNWSLQNISELLLNGIDAEVTHFITPSSETDSHQYEEVPSAVVAIEAMFDLITDIILRDQILVEEEFASVWLDENGPLKNLAEQSVIKAFPFLGDPELLIGPRDEFVSRLCLTSSLKKEHKENVHGWALNNQVPHPYLSQTIWGGAGMLARAFVYEKGYTPHPVRRRLLQKAGIALSDTDAVIRTCNVIEEKRASIRSQQSSNHELYSLQVNMEPLPIKVIREASSPTDIMTVALQIRDDYAELRDWLGQYQKSINNGDYKEIQKHQKILSSISKYVDSTMGKSTTDNTTFTVGINIFNIAMKGSPINTLQNQFGVRAMINKLILGASGTGELKRLLKFFEHHNTSIGMQVLEHFSA
ncbi:hypothetical protein ACIDE9_03175 [Methylophilus sp. 'Pure River']|uniref:hypothetical protein n=1 Tax=Methylophilus sp. 'Pure River' TaxID=3377117 RepID=UPI00398F8DDD